MKIAIIGSSLSGILAAEILKDKDISLFEKGDSKLSIDNNKIIKNAKIYGKKSTSINEGLGGTSELWTGGLVRKFPNKKISKNKFKVISEFLQSDTESLFEDIRYEDGFIFQKTIVLDKPTSGKKYLKKLHKRSKLKIYQNCEVISINCRDEKIFIKYKLSDSEKTFVKKYDYCFLSNGTLGFHKLLPNIFFNGKSFLKNNQTFKIATHPKGNIGYATSEKWELWNKGIINIKINSNNYSYERIIFEMDNNGSSRSFAIRLLSRRLRYMIKIAKFFKIFDSLFNIKIDLLITNYLDKLYCNFAKFLKLKEYFFCELFIADEFKGESFIEQNTKSINLKCSIKNDYNQKIYQHIINKKKSLEKKFNINLKINSPSKWPITILHSHLCSTLLEDNYIIDNLKKNKIIPLSCLELPVGYFNPMIESLLNTQDKLEEFR